MSAGIEHNARQQAARMNAAALAIRAELKGSVTGLAQRIAARMKMAAPKFRSTLENSIRVDRLGEFDAFIGPHEDYGLWVEKGRKPGKGLPVFDPALPIVAWLKAQFGATSLAGPARPQWRTGKTGSAREEAAYEDLRARYLAFSRHVKFKGLRAHPYVKPTADAFREAVPSDLAAAVRRGIQRATAANNNGARA